MTIALHDCFSVIPVSDRGFYYPQVSTGQVYVSGEYEVYNFIVFSRPYGRAYATGLRTSVVCNVKYCG